MTKYKQQGFWALLDSPAWADDNARQSMDMGHGFNLLIMDVWCSLFESIKLMDFIFVCLLVLTVWKKSIQRFCCK